MIDAIIQYTIVFIILGFAIAWIIYRFFTKKGRTGNNGGCCGCALQDSCAKKKREDTRECCDKSRSDKNINSSE